MPKGQKVLVTGAQQGIGAAAAVALARSGGAVAINYLDDRNAAETVADDVRAAGGSAVVLQGDIGTADGATELVRRADETLGGLDLLVNNAGIFPATPALDVTEAEWDNVLDVNLKGAFFCAQETARTMIRDGTAGAIINLSSIAVMGIAGGPHYVASKGALIALTRSLAHAFAPHGIRVNAVAPGLVDTAQPRSHMTDAQFEHVANNLIPLRRSGEAEDIASSIEFLASPSASFITGQTIHVNGGQWMY